MTLSADSSRASLFGALPPGYLVVAAHPEDTVLRAAVLLLRNPGALVLHVTDGVGDDVHPLPAPLRGRHAVVRQRETAASLAYVGVAPPQQKWLGVPVGAAMDHLAEIARALAVALISEEPPVLLTHRFTGGERDEDATAIALQAALRIARRLGKEGAPPVLELDDGASLDEDDAAITLDVDEQERGVKRAMLACHVSQRARLASASMVERFRLAPADLLERVLLRGSPAWRRRVELLARELQLDLGAEAASVEPASPA